MKKLSAEDSNVFPHGKVIVKIFAVLIFFSYNIFSQTLLNNFGISRIIKTHSGYTKFTFLDFNKDGIEDLFLFGNQGKSFILHQGLMDSTFAKPIRKFFFYPIDDIKWLRTTKTGDDYYIFISRNKRIVGLVSFTKSQSLQLLHKIEFNSYPSSVEIVDLDKDGNNEALVFGNNFDGLMLIENDGYQLYSESLLEQNVFADIEIIDFNQDEYEDVILIDVLNNSINFYENTGHSRLILNRKIEFEENISLMKTVDFNNDQIIDLGVIKEGGIDFFIGDSVYSFANKYQLSFDFTPDNFLMHDFNFDQKNDLAVINKVENQLIVKTNVDSNDFNIVCTFDGITDFEFSYSRNSLVTLSKKSKIQLMSSENLWGYSFSYSVGGNLEKVYYKSRKGFLSSNFIVSDLQSNSLNILKIDSIGNFIDLTTTPFLNNISEVCFSSGINDLVNYSKNSRLLEILSHNEVTNNFDIKNYFYTTYPIQQFYIDENNVFHCLETIDNNIFYEKISKLKGKYISTELTFIDSSVINSSINDKNEIIYWTKRNDEFIFYKYYNENSEQLLIIAEKDSLEYKAIINNNFRTSNSSLILTVFNYGDNEKIYMRKGNNVKNYQCDTKIITDQYITDKNLFIYNSINFGENLFVHQQSEKKILILGIDHINKSLELIKTIEAININDYFVRQFFGNTYLIYTNASENCLSFKMVNL